MNKKIVKRVFGDAVRADVFVTVEMADGHTFDKVTAEEIVDGIAAQAMLLIANAPKLGCPLTRVKVSGR